MMRLSTQNTICNRFSFGALLAILTVSVLGTSYGQIDVSGVPSEKLLASQDPNKEYFLIGASEDPNAGPDGFGLVVVVPGGDGDANFNTFVKQIYLKSLSKKYIVTQLVAVKWTEDQQIVWPTKKLPVEKQKFSTEAFIEAVIKDVKASRKINNDHVFVLAWSSGGPAAYSYSLAKKKSATGSYIAMSVFKPEELPPLEQAKGHAYFIFHCKEDEVCPYSMAKQAEQSLVEKGATVKFVRYSGGHGWPVYPFGRIQVGIKWLEANHGEPPAVPNQLEPKPQNAGKAETPSKTDLPPIAAKRKPEMNPLFWIIDKTGQYAVEPKFGGKCGFIDKTGKFVWGPK